MYSIFDYNNLPRSPGIYRIVEKTTGRFYIGSSVNIRKRIVQHVYSFNREIHSNPIMQPMWNKYRNTFFVEVVELIESKEKHVIIGVEQKYLDEAQVGKNPLCMNILIVANSHLGVRRPQYAVEALRQRSLGKKASPETRLKQRLAKLGRKQTPEQIAKRTAGQKGRPCNRPKGILMPTLRKLSPDQVRELRKLKESGVSYTELKKIYGLGHGTIQKIVARQSYADVQ